jgi:pentatricopeptide repeat protein
MVGSIESSPDTANILERSQPICRQVLSITQILFSFEFLQIKVILGFTPCIKTDQIAAIKADEVVYGALINAFAQAGNVEEAVHYFQIMQDRGFVANCTVYSSLIKVYRKIGRLREAQETYEMMKKLGDGPDVFATNCESAADMFELLFKMVESENARLCLTVKGFLRTICRLITEEVVRIEAQERSFHIDISQGFILHKLIELLSKFLEVPNIRSRFMRDELLSRVLEALLVIRGLIVQKTKLISGCNRLLRELLDSFLLESNKNKRLFIRACILGLQGHGQ